MASSLAINLGGAKALPLDIALTVIPSLPRAALERLVQRAIDHMDALDGDTDVEPEETDHTNGEDDFYLAPTGMGPGCPYADCDLGVDDGMEDDRSDLEFSRAAPVWEGGQ